MLSCEVYDKDKYKSYREYLDKNYFNNLFYSACFYLIPTLIAIYKNYLDHFILMGGTFTTATLRWGYPSNKYFMIIDHIYVKIVYILYFLYAYYSLNATNEIYIYFCIFYALVGLIYFFLGSHLNSSQLDNNIFVVSE